MTNLTDFYHGYQFHPTPYTFKPDRSCVGLPCQKGDRTFDEFAVFDTLSEVPPAEGRTITCVQWLNWAGGDKYYMRELQDLTVIGALIVAPTGEGNNIYRRIGWLEVFDADFFDKEPQDIELV